MSDTVLVTMSDLVHVEIDRHSTQVRAMAEIACRRALEAEGFNGLSMGDYDLNAGIVGSTMYGDRYPELWLASDRRLRPHQFGSAVLNSVVGHCSLVFHLTGPQILVTRGSPEEVAQLQFAMNRSRLMIVCRYEDTAVSVHVLRKEAL